MARKSKQYEGHDSSDRSRICSLSDCIIAFAMTLLAFQIVIPSPATTAGTELPNAVADLWPKFVSYIFGFIMIGYYWMLHHRVIAKIVRFDNVTLWLNIGFLLAIVLMPFSAALIGEYEEHAFSATLFAANCGLIGIMLSMISYHALKQGAFLDEAYMKNERYYLMRGMLPAIVFIASIPVAQFSVHVAVLMWLSIPFLLLFLKKKR